MSRRSTPPSRQAIRKPGWRPSGSAESARRAATAGEVRVHRIAVEHHDRARNNSASTSAIHIIQAVVVYQSIPSPGCWSQLRPWFLHASIRMPPWRCTIAFGSPVVPEEKRTQSGWSKATGSNRAARARRAARPTRARPAAIVGPAAHGTCTMCSRLGSALADLGDFGAAVDLLPAVAVAADREQELRLELAEAVDHAARPELRRAGRPDRPEARRGQERDQRLRDVGR